MATQSLRARLSDESGQILVLASISMVALLGITALSLDASFMFAKRNRLHAAADAAAKSAAIELVRNGAVTQVALEAFADQQVAALGFSPVRFGGTTTVTVNRPPTSGIFAGHTSYVEALVSEPTSTFFGRILGWTSMTPGASAVAGAGNPTSCLITKEDMSIGNMSVVLNGCGLSVGGNLAGTNPNSEVVGTPTPSVGVVGTCSGTCTNMGSLLTNAPAPVDPLAGLALPADPGGCTAGVAATLSPGCYTSIADTVTTLNPGIYYVTGKVDIGNLSGTGVMIFLTGAGQLTAKQNKSIALTAPTSGPYTGIAIFQDPANSNNIDIENNFTVDITGVIYMPSVDVDFKNAVTFTVRTCTLFIAKSLTIKNGNGTLSSNGCAATFGGAAFLSATIAQ
jgi:Flp pilus assembly protein TadG